MTSNVNLFDGVVVFYHVVNCQGFSAAAEKTGHSASYISKEINRLEARLGVRLLNRTTRTISLTPEGKAYFQQCQQLIHDAELSLGELNQSQITAKGLIKISCPVSFGLNYLQPILSKFLKKFPQVTLEVDFNDRQVNVIEEGFDLVIRATNKLDESSLVCRKVLKSKGVTVASPAYLTEYGTPTHPAELRQHACLCYANLKMPSRWKYLTFEGKEITVEVGEAILCNSANFELAMAKAGHGICRLPAFELEDAIENGTLVEIFSNFQQPVIDVYAIYPSRKYLLPKIRIFIDFLVQEMPALV